MPDPYADQRMFAPLRFRLLVLPAELLIMWATWAAIEVVTR